MFIRVGSRLGGASNAPRTAHVTARTANTHGRARLQQSAHSAQQHTPTTVRCRCLRITPFRLAHVRAPQCIAESTVLAQSSRSICAGQLTVVLCACVLCPICPAPSPALAPRSLRCRHPGGRAHILSSSSEHAPARYTPARLVDHPNKIILSSFSLLPTNPSPPCPQHRQHSTHATPAHTLSRCCAASHCREVGSTPSTRVLHRPQCAVVRDVGGGIGGIVPPQIAASMKRRRGARWSSRAAAT